MQDGASSMTGLRAPITYISWAIKHFLYIHLRKCQLKTCDIYNQSVRTGDLVTQINTKKIQIFSQLRFHCVSQYVPPILTDTQRHLHAKALANSRHYRERTWEGEKKAKVCHKVLIFTLKINQKLE